MDNALGPVEAFETIQRLLADGSDAISFSRHAYRRAAQRQLDRRDVQRVLTTGTVGANPEWNDQFQNWRYRVTGTDLDGEKLTLIIALEPKWTRITIITGF